MRISHPKIPIIGSYYPYVVEGAYGFNELITNTNDWIRYFNNYHRLKLIKICHDKIKKLINQDIIIRPLTNLLNDSEYNYGNIEKYMDNILLSNDRKTRDLMRFTYNAFICIKELLDFYYLRQTIWHAEAFLRIDPIIFQIFAYDASLRTKINLNLPSDDIFYTLSYIQNELDIEILQPYKEGIRLDFISPEHKYQIKGKDFRNLLDNLSEYDIDFIKNYVSNRLVV